MRALIISNNSRKIGALEMLASDFFDEVRLEHFDAIDFSSVELYDVVILSGGSGLAVPRNREKLAMEFSLVRQCKKPIVGICLGFEVIVDVFGGELKYRSEKIDGLVEIRKKREHQIFDSRKTYKVHESHKYYADSLPKELTVLAESDFGVEIFEHVERPIWGMQFHPENQIETNDGKFLFGNLVQYIHENYLV